MSRLTHREAMLVRHAKRRALADAFFGTVVSVYLAGRLVFSETLNVMRWRAESRGGRADRLEIRLP